MTTSSFTVHQARRSARQEPVPSPRDRSPQLEHHRPRSAAHRGRAMVLGGLAAVGLIGTSCSGSGGSTTAGSNRSTLEIVSCSLGCAPGGTSISCGPLNIFTNQLISVEFSDDIDPESIDKNTFRVVEVGTGAVPTATFRLDPNNARRVLYRPSLSFDSQGNPVYGLIEGSTYRLTIGGISDDDGPSDSFIRSVSGRPNQTQLECTLSATQGTTDLQAGQPSVEVFLQRVQPDGSTARTLANDTQLSNVRFTIDVPSVEIEFDDLMDPSTLVNPVTGVANLISVGIDPDGDIANPSDQVELPGSFTIQLDEAALKTTVRYIPDIGLPSGIVGDDIRLLVVNLPLGIVDLGGNPLTNGGAVSAIPEQIIFELGLLPPGGEDFSELAFRDPKRTGTIWGPIFPDAALGALRPGTGGGSGRLGDFEVKPGAVFVLDTANSVFDSKQLVTDYDPVTGEPVPITVDDGIFEFATLDIRPGAVLRFEGEHPARVFSRGTMLVQGVVDLTGESKELFPSTPCDVTEVDPNSEFYCEHLDPLLVGADPVTEADSIAYLTTEGLIDSYFDGQVGGLAGAGGGAGGKGGDLPGYDSSIEPSLSASNGLNNLDAVIDTAGQSGEGVPVPNTINPTGTAGGGQGGVAWPAVFPTAANQLAGLVFSIFCHAPQVGGAGGGGANASSGDKAQNKNLENINGPPIAPAAPGGDATELLAEVGVETLSPHLGLLRGGAGGGGAGAGAGDSELPGFFPNCGDTISDYRTSRGGGGGGGGGAVQLQAGKRLVVDGFVDVGGGQGGGSGNASSPFNDRLNETAAGGAGGGGSILLQAEQVELASGPGILRIQGGPAQKGSENQSRGGLGGLGRLRVETGLSADQLISFPALLDRVSPTASEAAALPGAPALTDIVSLVNWSQLAPFDLPLIDLGAEPQPELRSAAQSCWLKPSGNVFVTEFFADDTEELGWDMDIFYAGTNQLLSYRTPTPALAGLSPEQFLDQFADPLFGAGNPTEGSPIEIRFQGARSIGQVADPCDSAGEGSTSPFVAGSLTPWVRDPAELNTINGSESLRPNWVRYQVIFDRNFTFANLGFPTVSVLDLFPGVTNFFIRARGL